MPPLEAKDQPSPAILWAAALVRRLASLRLAVVLMVVLALGVLGPATFLEKIYGHEYALWYVYSQPWFVALWGLLAANILAAMMVRYPWGPAEWGSLMVHGGVLVLMIGALETYLGGVEGRLNLVEGKGGETASEFVVADQCRLTVGRQAAHGGERNRTNSFTFPPGPVEWPAGKTLDLGYSGGVGLTVLRYYPHAEIQENWQADASGSGDPAVEFALTDSHGKTMSSSWLEGSPFAGRLDYGPWKFELQKAGANSQAEDFLHPPKEEMDKDGVLAIHYQGQRHCIPVSENLGKKIPVGDSGATVEITAYLPNAQPGEGGKFKSEGNEPLNPMLDLQVSLPGKETPVRQIAFARNPLLNFDLMHGRACPVKFWYHHPAIGAAPGIEFLQTPDGKLYYRLGIGGQYRGQGEAHPGDTVAIGNLLQLKILKRLPAARKEVNFVPAETPEAKDTAEAAVLVEVDAEDATRRVWLLRNDPDFSVQTLDTPEGPLMVSFGYERAPLDFSLKLLRFERGMNPGRVGDASYASTVRLIDRAARLNEKRVISMNHPLVHGKYMFYQSSYHELPNGTAVSILGVAYDPGRAAKHLGCILVCGGMVVMFFFKKRPAKGDKPRAALRATEER